MKLALLAVLPALAFPAVAQQPILWETPVEGDIVTMFGAAAKGKLVFVTGTELVNQGANFFGQLLGAFDRKTGEQAWLEQGDVATDIGSGAAGEAFLDSVAVSKSVVVAGGGRDVEPDVTEGSVRAYDQKSGTLLWSKQFPFGSVTTRVAAVGKRAYAMTTLQEPGERALLVEAYDLLTGDELWSEPLDLDDESLTGFALAATSGFVAVTGGRAGVGLGNIDLFVRVFDAKTGELDWDDTYDASGGFDLGICLAAKGKRLYVGGTQASEGGGDDGFLRAYDLADGDILWTKGLTAADTNLDEVLALAVRGSRVVALSQLDGDDVMARAFSAKTGVVQWDELVAEDADVQARPIGLSGSRCVIATSGGPVALDAKDGTPVWDAPLEGQSATIIGKRVVVPGGGGVAAYLVK